MSFPSFIRHNSEEMLQHAEDLRHVSVQDAEAEEIGNSTLNGARSDKEIWEEANDCKGTWRSCTKANKF